MNLDLAVTTAFFRKERAAELNVHIQQTKETCGTIPFIKCIIINIVSFVGSRPDKMSGAYPQFLFNLFPSRQVD